MGLWNSSCCCSRSGTLPPPEMAFEMTGKEMKYIRIGKIAAKLSFFTDDKFKYVASPTECR